MPNITGHTELVGLMAYPIRHTQSPTTHNLAYDKNGDDVIQLAFEVDNSTLKEAVESIRALKMLGSNISMPNKTVVHQYLDEVDEAAKLCGAINTVVNLLAMRTAMSPESSRATTPMAWATGRASRKRASILRE